MDTIKTASGKLYETDYLASIPNPKMVFFRLPKLSFTEAAILVTNSTEMARIEYNGYYFNGLELNSLQNENGVPKASMTYEEFGSIKRWPHD